MGYSYLEKTKGMKDSGRTVSTPKRTGTGSPREYYHKDYVMDFEEWKAEQSGNRLLGGFLVFIGLCLCLLDYWLRFHAPILPDKEIPLKLDLILFSCAALFFFVGSWKRRQCRVSQASFETYVKTHTYVLQQIREHRAKNARIKEAKYKALIKEILLSQEL